MDEGESASNVGRFFQAKKYVESLPQVVRGDIPKDEAEKLKAQLEAAGGIVEMD